MIGDKFYFVDAKDIEQSILICKNNGYEKTFQSIGRKTANEIFTLNDIPLKYQKIVLRSSVSKRIKSRITDKVLSKQNNYYAEEYISGFSFCEVVQSGKGDMVSLINSPFYDEQSKQWFFNYISCMCNVRSISSSSIISFFTELKNNKLIDAYFKSLCDLFELNKSSVDVLNGRLEDFKYSGYQKVLK